MLEDQACGKEKYKIQRSFSETSYLSTCLSSSRNVLVCIPVYHLLFHLLYQLLSDACHVPRFVYTGVPGIVLSVDEYLLFPLLISNSFSFSIKTTLKEHFTPLIFHYPDSGDSYRCTFITGDFYSTLGTLKRTPCSQRTQFCSSHLRPNEIKYSIFFQKVLQGNSFLHKCMFTQPPWCCTLFWISLSVT